jgi:hypothetical protein
MNRLKKDGGGKPCQLLVALPLPILPLSNPRIGISGGLSRPHLRHRGRIQELLCCRARRGTGGLRMRAPRPRWKALSSSRRRWCGDKAKSRASVAGSLLPGAEAKRRLGADSLNALGLAAWDYCHRLIQQCHRANRWTSFVISQNITTMDLGESRP